MGEFVRGLVVLFLFVPFWVQAQVVAVGHGSTESEALKSAFVNAVDQTVGTFISSKLQIENGELIEDKVLSLSRGFIESYKPVSTERVSGGYKVTIEAVVKEDAVKAKVTEVFKSEVGIDISEFAKAYTKSTRNLSGKELIKAEFPRLAAALVDSLRMDIVKVTIDSDKATDKVPFRVDLRLSVDKDKYGAVIKELDGYLVQLGAEKSEFGYREVLAGSLYVVGTDGKVFEYSFPSVLEETLLEYFFLEIDKKLLFTNWSVVFVSKDGSFVKKDYDLLFAGIAFKYSFSEYLMDWGKCGSTELDSSILWDLVQQYNEKTYSKVLLSALGKECYWSEGLSKAKVVFPKSSSLSGAEGWRVVRFSDLKKEDTTDFYVSGEMSLSELENLRKIEVSRVR
jgi:hypothetical protein